MCGRKTKGGIERKRIQRSDLGSKTFHYFSKQRRGLGLFTYSKVGPGLSYRYIVIFICARTKNMKITVRQKLHISTSQNHGEKSLMV